MKLHLGDPTRVMRIKIKDLNAESMEITENGMELEFRDKDGKHIGDLIVTSTHIIWNKGKTSKAGNRKNWAEFFKLMRTR